ncbi:hypothetical protein [Mycolicibacterium litorale]|uniref:Secreted protein n=1 Tax=Mycolicibacterium litorale TaxID=758802 RepID=A0AAD1IP61_9MYCO|nr:hypothetical protein [Mycolicibacterium litorale]MCV7417125.1 hypothetical protein [Mycolicibacterium litorale]TDY04913.1 hypothetical protein BCL50_3694 [Mycolicibacterium litorale]BBY18341.1 hypothetical protein MLIT_39330 [Mycolicibacterium litorale]
MIRACLALSVAATTALAGVVGATDAHAQPSPPCTFTLSNPVVVPDAGAPAVAATLQPVECGWSAEPDYTVACLQITGNPATTCVQSRGRDGARVVYSPYVPGTSYTATGRGCGRWVGQPPAPLCQHLGPYTAML